MTQSADDAYWRDLESNAHLPEVQELIRQEIQSGTIRVCPNGESGIRILPVDIPESEQPIEVEPIEDEPIEVELPPTPSQDESPPRKVAFRGRLPRL